MYEMNCCRDNDIATLSHAASATPSYGLIATAGIISMYGVPTVQSVFDAGECQPGLLSMEWYPSLFLKFFHQLIFPCRHTCSLETHGTIPTSLLVFVENVFTSLIVVVTTILIYIGTEGS